VQGFIQLPTQHHCFVEGKRDGYLLENVFVCGLAISVLCSSKYDNEGIFWCEMHFSNGSCNAENCLGQ
jgi:hypothetical protein